jgi:glycogen synthase
MRILVITALYPPDHLGGYEIRCREIVEHLKARGHQVLVLTSRSHGNGTRPSAGVRRLLNLEPSKNMAQRIAWDVHDLRSIGSAVRQWAPEVAYLFHTVQLTRTLLPYLARLGMPVVYDEGGKGLLTAWRNHGRWFAFSERRGGSRVKRRLRRTFVNAVRALSRDLLPTEWCLPAGMLVYFNNEHTLRLTQEAGVPIRDARVIHSGIDLSKFPFRSGRTDSGTVRFVLPGRVSREKNIEDAIGAVRGLTARRPEVHFSLEIVGPIQDAAYHEELQKLAGLSAVQDCIRYTPGVPHETTSEAYRKADFCFLLSHVEYFSRVALEAMASGSVLITTAAGGGQEVVRHGVNGIVAPAGAPERIADAVATLLDSERDYLRIQQDARAYVEKNHDFESYVDKIEAVLTEAVAWGK